MDSERFNRSIRFFGPEGQKKIEETTIMIVGQGGIGSHCTQQAAIDGYGQIYPCDPDEFDHTSRNRAVGLWDSDPTPGTPKVDALARLANMINPAIAVHKIAESFISEAGFAAIEASDYVIGCLDKEWPRLVLLEVCASLQTPLIDIASEIYPDRMQYGGRACCCFAGKGCLSCLGLIDQKEVRREQATAEDVAEAQDLYGVNRELLGDSGPSVGAINGVVALNAMAELQYWVTGIREPQALLTYKGHMATTVRRQQAPNPDCYYCAGLWTGTVQTDIRRYLNGDGKS